MNSRSNNLSPSQRLRSTPGASKPLNLGPQHEAPVRRTKSTKSWRKNWTETDRCARENPSVSDIPSNAKKPLSKAQKHYLARIAGEAWQIQHDHGLTDLDKDAWRRLVVAQITGCPGLRHCQNGHFRGLKQHFLLLAGDGVSALQVPPTGPTGSVVPGELVEDRETLLHLIRRQLGSTGYHENYALKIARTTFHLPPSSQLEALNSAQLTALYFTLRRRAAGRKK